MQLRDDLNRGPTGEFALQVYRNGELIEEWVDKNLIVANSTQIHALLLGGQVTNNSITKFGVGTNGTAPASGNTGLTGAFTKAVDSVSYPASNQVQFGFSLASGEANSMAILEFGLFTAAGTLYARKVRSAALNKDTDIAISGTWTISF